MHAVQHAPLSVALFAAAAGLLCPMVCAGQMVKAAPAIPARAVPGSKWDSAFQDHSGNQPLHFTARYLDARSTVHRLEEWRLGEKHLRRRTDDRIDLHADASGPAYPGQPLDYTWQILDLQKHIAHHVSTAGMLHLGMLYSYYAMAHLLTRPAGNVDVQRSAAPKADVPTEALQASLLRIPACQWWQIDAPTQASTRVCWMPRYGMPAQIWSHSPAGWHPVFRIDTLDTHPIPPGSFITHTAGFQVRSVDEMEGDD